MCLPLKGSPFGYVDMCHFVDFPKRKYWQKQNAQQANSSRSRWGTKGDKALNRLLLEGAACFATAAAAKALLQWAGPENKKRWGAKP
jgi:hypothetical protein